MPDEIATILGPESGIGQSSEFEIYALIKAASVAKKKAAIAASRAPIRTGANTDPCSGKMLNPSAPGRAEALLHWFLPKPQRDFLIGDLEEEFRTIIVPKLGERAARRWYWFQAIRSVVPVFRSWVFKTSIGGGIIWVAGWISERLG